MEKKNPTEFGKILLNLKKIETYFRGPYLYVILVVCITL